MILNRNTVSGKEERIPKNLKQIGDRHREVNTVINCQEKCGEMAKCVYFRWKKGTDPYHTVCILYEAPEDGQVSYNKPSERPDRFVSGHKSCQYCETCTLCLHCGPGTYGPYGGYV